MNKIRNQKGHSLLTVFLTMTIFTIIFMAFIGYSFNTVKQNNVVEQKTQADAIAEMGVSYFQTAIKDIYDSDIRDEVNKLVKEHSKNEWTYSEFANEAVTLMEDSLKRKVEEKFEINFPPELAGQENLDKPSFNKVVANGISYSIENIDIIGKNEEVNIYFDSVGQKDGNTSKGATINSHMKISLKDISSEDEAAPGGIRISVVIELPTFNQIGRPLCLINCKDVLVSNLTGIVLLSTENILTNNIFKTIGLDSKIIHSNNSLTLDLNLNKDLTDLNLHSVGPMTLDANTNKNNHSSHTKIESEDDLTVNGHFSVTGDSKIYVKNNMNVTKSLLIDESYLYVGGNAEINKNTEEKDENGKPKPFDIGVDCRVCIKGNLDVGNLTIDTTSELIVGGNLIMNGKQITDIQGTNAFVATKVNLNNNGTLKNDGTFERLCKQPKYVVLPYEWITSINNDIEYIYK